MLTLYPTGYYIDRQDCKVNSGKEKYKYIICKATNGELREYVVRCKKDRRKKAGAIMPRRVKRDWDEDRTALLGQEELFVQKGCGSEQYFFVWHQEPEVECCPRCKGTAIKTQDLFSKTYLDLLQSESSKQPVTLQYEFYKYRCLNCGHVFARSIHFATQNDFVTYRFEDEVAHEVIAGYSYEEISNRLQNVVSRQAVGQIFNRWVHKKEELRQIQSSPTKLAIVSGKLDRDFYTLILNLDDGIRVYDALYGISAAEIAAAIMKIGTEHIQLILSDCDPVISTAIQDRLPGVDYVIPVDYWFGLVSEDFKSFAHDILKWSHVRRKEEIIIMPPGSLGYDELNLKTLLKTRPQIQKPYDDYNHLRNILSRRDELWIFEELLDWADSLDDDFKEALSATIIQLKVYQKQIEAQLQHWDDVPENLFRLTSKLEELMSRQKFRTFSEEILKARLLYSVETNLQDWRGVPIDDVIRALEAEQHILEE